MQRLFEVNSIMKKNIYEKSNPKLYSRLQQVLKTAGHFYKLHIDRDKELKKWIDDSLPLLKNEEYTLQTKLYWLTNGLTKFPKCANPECHHDFEHTNVINSKQGYSSYCSNTCANRSAVSHEKMRSTRKKHLEEDPSYLDKIDQKTKATKAEKYGDPNYTNRSKATQTIKEKYGTDWFVQTDTFKQKSEQTLLEHFGVDHAWKSDICRQHGKDTCIRLYGDKNYNNREQAEKTCIERYAVDNPAKSDSAKEKTKQTYLKHYSVDHDGKDKNVRLKCQNTNMKLYNTKYGTNRRYLYNSIYFDSSWELAYYIWLTDNHIGFKYHSITLTFFDEDNESHIYEPDFLLTKTNQLIEIKGTQLYDEKTQTLKNIFQKKTEKAKQKCMIENNVEIISYSKIQPILKYIQLKYGKSYLKMFKCKSK